MNTHCILKHIGWGYVASGDNLGEQADRKVTSRIFKFNVFTFSFQPQFSSF